MIATIATIEGVWAGVFVLGIFLGAACLVLILYVVVDPWGTLERDRQIDIALEAARDPEPPNPQAMH